MSTRINVTVDLGGLRERNKQQVTANRFAYLERLEDERFRAAAQKAQADRLTAEGLDGQGRTLYWCMGPNGQPGDELAASLTAGFDVAGVWVGSEQTGNVIEYKIWSRNGLQSAVYKTETVQEITPDPQSDPYEGTSTQTFEDVADSTLGSAELFIVLPVRDDKLIFAYVRAFNQSRLYAEKTISSTWRNELRTAEAGYQYYELLVDTTISSGGLSFEQGPAGINVRAWLVSNASVREIDAPVAFQARLKEFIYDWSLESYSPVLNAESNREAVYSPVLPGAGDAPDPPQQISIYEIQTSFTPPIAARANGVINASHRWNGSTYYVNVDERSGRIERSGGPTAAPYDWFDGSLRRLKTLGVANGSPVFGPGSFYAFNNPTTVISASATGADIGSEFFMGTAPRISLLERFVESTQYFDYVKGLYHDLDPREIGPARPNPGYRLLWYPPSLEEVNAFLYSAWDWGNPGYCRQQLLALGFNSADLI